MNTKGIILAAALLLLFLCFGGCENETSQDSIQTPAQETAAIVLPAEDSQEPTQTEMHEAVQEPEQAAAPDAAPEAVQIGEQKSAFEPVRSATMWGDKFPGRFTDGRVLQGSNYNVSEHVSVTVKKVQEDGLTYFAADIYITDLKYFISPFSDGEYLKGQRKFVYDISRDLGAVVAVNADYYSENAGPILRDGVLYRNEVKCDILVMYKDGSMQTFDSSEYDVDSIEAMKEGVWQIWTFGPMLLDNGQPMSEFNFSKNVGSINPRTAVGYYEPGHYVFVTVDGRQPGYSDGLDMEGVSQLMYDLGCSVAFNLDGGGTSQMAFLGEEISRPSVHRKTRDALCIIDETYTEVFY